MKIPIWLERAQYRALKEAPYAATAFAAAKFVITDLVQVNGHPTMASDEGWRVYVHPALESQHTCDELAWILLHEILGHLAQNHAKQTRLGGYNSERANEAQDLAIECWKWPTLKRAKGGLHPLQYGFPENRLWQEYYELLNQKHKCQTGKTGKPGGISGISGSGESGKTGGERGENGKGGKNKSGENGGNGENGENGKIGSHNKCVCCGNCGSAADGVARSWELAENDKDFPALRQEIADAIRKKTAEAIRDYAAKKGCGNIPYGLSVWADSELAPPVVPWKRVLRGALTRELRRGMRDLSGPSREHRMNGILRPTWAQPQLRIAIVADTSGSMKTAGGRVLGEIVGIIRETGTPVDVFWCDAAYKKQKGVRSRIELKPQGGGGTDIRPAIEAALSTRPFYDKIVIITDCDIVSWPRPNSRCYVVGVNRKFPTGWHGMVVSL